MTSVNTGGRLPKRNIFIRNVEPQLDNEDILAVSLYGNRGKVAMEAGDATLADILAELRIINLQLAIITDNWLEEA